jgi:hypothetical protein
MKIKNCLLILAASVVVLTSSDRSHAQSQLSFDGYGASPRLRQMMEDRNVMWLAMGGSEVVADGSMRMNTTVAAPRTQQVTIVPAAHDESEWVGYKTTDDDGIAASPRLRQMMDDRYAMQMAMGGSETMVITETGGRVSARHGTYVAQNEQRIATPNSELQSIGFYKTTGDDGIAASPRLRQMMNDRVVAREVLVVR